MSATFACTLNLTLLSYVSGMFLYIKWTLMWVNRPRMCLLSNDIVLYRSFLKQAASERVRFILLYKGQEIRSTQK